jgi:hypothetical protein
LKELINWLIGVWSNDLFIKQIIPCDFFSLQQTRAIFPIVIDIVGADYWWTDFGGCHTTEDIPDHDIFKCQESLLFAHILSCCELPLFLLSLSVFLLLCISHQQIFI